MSVFQRYIGIDYSGAKTPDWRLKSLQVYEARGDGEPEKVSTSTEGAKNWNRQEIAQFCFRAIEGNEPVIIGIDHGFSLPLSYMQRSEVN